MPEKKKSKKLHHKSPKIGKLRRKHDNHQDFQFSCKKKSGGGYNWNFDFDHKFNLDLDLSLDFR